MTVSCSARVRPYLLTRCTTKTGKFYMRRDYWQDMNDLGWGWRHAEGERVSRYFESDAMNELRSWCQDYVTRHPGNTLDPKEAEAIAYAALSGEAA